MASATACSADPRSAVERLGHQVGLLGLVLASLLVLYRAASSLSQALEYPIWFWHWGRPEPGGSAGTGVRLDLGEPVVAGWCQFADLTAAAKRTAAAKSTTLTMQVTTSVSGQPVVSLSGTGVQRGAGSVSAAGRLGREVRSPGTGTSGLLCSARPSAR